MIILVMIAEGVKRLLNYFGPHALLLVSNDARKNSGS